MVVSIITVTFNSSATVRDTLESINRQTFRNIEHIIIDGLSTDNTLDIVADFSHVNKVFSEADNGVYDAMNKGVRHATGDIIGILNSDDVFASASIIAEVVDIFANNSDVDALYGNIEYFKEDKIDEIVRFWKTKPYYDGFFEDGETPPHPSLFVRKRVYDNINHYFPDFKIASDYEFMFRMFKVNNYKPFFFDKTIVKMRVGGISTSGFKSYWQSTKELKQVWEMNGYKYPKKLYFLRPYKKIRQLI